MVCKVNYCKHKMYKISVLNEKLFIANSGRIAMLLLSPKFWWFILFVKIRFDASGNLGSSGFADKSAMLLLCR